MPLGLYRCTNLLGAVMGRLHGVIFKMTAIIRFISVKTQNLKKKKDVS
jgi:hypothetical protein